MKIFPTLIRAAACGILLLASVGSATAQAPVLSAVLHPPIGAPAVNPYSVAIDGDILAAAISADDNYRGGVSIYERNARGEWRLSFHEGTESPLDPLSHGPQPGVAVSGRTVVARLTDGVLVLTKNRALWSRQTLRVGAELMPVPGTPGFDPHSIWLDGDILFLLSYLEVHDMIRPVFSSWKRDAAGVWQVHGEPFTPELPRTERGYFVQAAFKKGIFATSLMGQFATPGLLPGQYEFQYFGSFVLNSFSSTEFGSAWGMSALIDPGVTDFPWGIPAGFDGDRVAIVRQTASRAGAIVDFYVPPADGAPNWRFEDTLDFVEDPLLVEDLYACALSGRWLIAGGFVYGREAGPDGRWTRRGPVQRAFHHINPVAISGNTAVTAGPPGSVHVYDLDPSPLTIANVRAHPSTVRESRLASIPVRVNVGTAGGSGRVSWDIVSVTADPPLPDSSRIFRDDRGVWLRPLAAGREPRVYTIGVEANDAAGQHATGETTVTILPGRTGR